MKIEIVDRATVTLAKMKARLQDMKPAMEAIGAHMVKRTVKECFGKEQSPDGKPWAKRSDWYLKSIANRARNKKGANKKQGKPKILHDSGKLRASIVYDANSNYVDVGSNLAYATTHQFGAKKGQFGRLRTFSKRGKRWNVGSISYPWGDIPARPFLGITNEDRKYIALVLSRYVVGG